MPCRGSFSSAVRRSSSLARLMASTNDRLSATLDGSVDCRGNKPAARGPKLACESPRPMEEGSGSEIAGFTDVIVPVFPDTMAYATCQVYRMAWFALVRQGSQR